MRSYPTLQKFSQRDWLKRRGYGPVVPCSDVTRCISRGGDSLYFPEMTSPLPRDCFQPIRGRPADPPTSAFCRDPFLYYHKQIWRALI